MRKKNITKVLVMIMAAALMLTGCGATEDNETVSLIPSVSEEISESVETESIESEEIEETEEEEESASFSLVKKSESEKVFVQKATIEETVLSEEGGIIITAKELTYYEDWAELQIEIENTTDQIVDVYSDTLSYAVNAVNGMAMDFGYINSEIEPGMKAIEEMEIEADEFRLMGMKDIASIVVGFKVCDDDYNDLFVTGPVEIRTSIYDEYDFAKNTLKEAMIGDIWTNTGVTFDYLEPEINLEQNGVKILLAALATTESDEKIFFLEVQNDTEEDYLMNVSNVAVNGVTVCDGNWSADFVISGARAVFDISMPRILEDYSSIIDVNKIGKIAFDIICRDTEAAKVIDTLSLEFVIDKSAKETPMTGTTVYEEEGITINALEAYQIDDEYYIPLLVDNGTDKEIIIDDEYDSLSINGVMTDYFFYSQQISAGRKALFVIEMDEEDLEKLGISSPEGITSAQLTLELCDENYKNKKKITINIGE